MGAAIAHQSSQEAFILFKPLNEASKRWKARQGLRQSLLNAEFFDDSESPARSYSDPPRIIPSNVSVSSGGSSSHSTRGQRDASSTNSKVSRNRSSSLTKLRRIRSSSVPRTREFSSIASTKSGPGTRSHRNAAAPDTRARSVEFENLSKPQHGNLSNSAVPPDSQDQPGQDTSIALVEDAANVQKKKKGEEKQRRRNSWSAGGEGAAKNSSFAEEELHAKPPRRALAKCRKTVSNTINELLSTLATEELCEHELEKRVQKLGRESCKFIREGDETTAVDRMRQFKKAQAELMRVTRNVDELMAQVPRMQSALNLAERMIAGYFPKKRRPVGPSTIEDIEQIAAKCRQTVHDVANNVDYSKEAEDGKAGQSDDLGVSYEVLLKELKSIVGRKKTNQNSQPSTETTASSVKTSSLFSGSVAELKDESPVTITPPENVVSQPSSLVDKNSQKSSFQRSAGENRHCGGEARLKTLEAPCVPQDQAPRIIPSLTDPQDSFVAALSSGSQVANLMVSI